MYELAREMGGAIHVGDFQKIEELIGKGVRIEDAENPGSELPLAKAALAGNLKAVEMLLKHGQDPNAADLGGKSAMHFAAKRGSVEILIKLHACGGSLTVEEDTGVTPLSQAVSEQANSAVAWLVDRGADPFKPNKYGITPMKIAQEINANQCIAIFSALLARKEIENMLNSLPTPGYLRQGTALNGRRTVGFPQT